MNLLGIIIGASLVAQAGKESTCNAGDPTSIPGSGRSSEKGKATRSSILAWRIPWTYVHGVAESDMTELS